MLDVPRVWELGSAITEPTSTHELTILKSIDEFDAGVWNELVARAPEGTVFHHAEWVAAIESAFEYEPYHIVIRKDGNLIGLLPQFEMDLPKVPLRQLRSVYPGFGGPVIGTDRRAVLSAMMQATRDMCGGRRVLHEIRGCNPELLRYQDHLYQAGYRPGRYKARFVLDVARPYEEILEGMSRSRRRGIRRGRDHDYELVEESLNPRVIDRLHPVHVAHMEDVQGEPFPRTFFDSLTAMDDRLLVLSLYMDGEYAGSFVELLDDARSTVHGFLAAVLPSYYEYHASELMYDAAMRWAHEHGYRTYDFGGAAGDFENGIFQFKQGFGGRLAPNFYWERGFGPLWPAVRMARSLYIRRRDRGPGSGS